MTGIELLAAGLLHWGNEVWSCGTHQFATKINGGHDVRVTRIEGAVTAAPQTPSRWRRWVVKMSQALVVLHHDAPAVQAITTKPSNTNNQVDGGLFAVNPKTIGYNPVVVPVSYTFDPPVIVPQGVLRMRIDVEAPGPIKEGDCMVVETHLTIQWRQP